MRSSWEEYAAKGGDLVGEIDGEIHSMMSKINPDIGLKQFKEVKPHS